MFKEFREFMKRCRRFNKEIKKLNKETMKEMGITKKDLKNDENLQFELDNRVMVKMGII